MWELFLKMLDYNLTPDQCFMLLSLDKKIKTDYVNPETNISELFKKGYILIKQVSGKNVLSITDKGKDFIKEINLTVKAANKKSNSEVMGDDFLEKIKQYREIFPAIKLPSGKPARNNTKALSDGFKWFFEAYDYTWDDVFAATKMYVAEYRENNYLYMMTSQYFISKQDKNKVRKSELADYCDMIREGVSTEGNHFKENVV